MALLADCMAQLWVFEAHMVTESIFPAKGLSAGATVLFRRDVFSLDMTNQASLVGKCVIGAAVFPLASQRTSFVPVPVTMIN